MGSYRDSKIISPDWSIYNINTTLLMSLSKCPNGYVKANNETGSRGLRSPLTTFDRQDSQKDSVHRVGDFEAILTEERDKFRQYKSTYEIALDSEKKMRLELEGRLIKLKDEFGKRSVEIAELQSRENSVLHQSHDLKIQNQRLKNELQRQNQTFTDRIMQLEGQLEYQGRNFDDTTNKYTGEFQKFKKEGQEYVQALTYEYQRKIKTLDERARSAEVHKKEVVMENKRLNDIILTNQLEFDTQFRQNLTRLRSEDLKKSQMISRSFQQKYKGLQETKEVLVRRNQELSKSIQDKDKTIHDLEFNKHEQINRLNQEVEDLRQKNQLLSTHYDKIKAETKLNSTSVPTSDSLARDTEILRLQVSQKKQEVQSLKDLLRAAKTQMGELRNGHENLRQEQADRISSLQIEVRRYKEQYTKICETLKIKINETISVVSRSRPQ